MCGAGFGPVLVLFGFLLMKGVPSVECLLGFWIRIGQFGAEAEDLRVGVAATAGFLSFRSVLGFPESKPTRVSKLLGGSRIGQPSVLNSPEWVSMFC